MYEHRSVPGDSFLELEDGPKFCKNCYYIIAAKADPSVQAELTIARGNDAVGLTTYGILRQTLKKG